jgi:hypothetical protein
MGNLQVQHPKAEVRPVAPIAKKYTPPGRLMACQWVRGPLRLDSGNIHLPDNLAAKLENAGVRHTTAIMRVIAVGNEVKYYQPDDLILIPQEVTVFMVNFDGDETILVHEEGTFGKVDDGYKADLWELMRDA